MAIKAFTMPKWGIEMQEGTVAEWLVAEGAAFEKGQLIALVETDKITNEVEADYPAVLKKIVVPEGETRDVGALLAVFGDAEDSDADVAAFLDGFEAPDTSTAAGKEEGAAPKTAKPEKETASVSEKDFEGIDISPAARDAAISKGVDVSGLKGTGRNGRITKQDIDQAAAPEALKPGGDPVDIRVEAGAFDHVYASPLAKRLAVLHGVDLTKVTGTGARGRISKADVLALAKPAATPPAATFDLSNYSNSADVTTMTGVRKTIARRLTEAKSTIPHFYLRTDVEVDALIDVKRSAEMILGEKVSVTDFLIKAIALALIKHPNVNIQVHGDDIHSFPNADIAVAVATDKGVVTPVVRAVNMRRMEDIARTTRDLATRARDGQLTRDELEPGTFTISNLGMFCVDQFDAIINPPQGAILAVGGSRREFVEIEDGGTFVSKVALSMSCDHRAIDGAVGAQFLADLKALIEDPAPLFKTVAG